MKAFLLLICILQVFLNLFAQNVGIGINSPAARLDVTKPLGDTPTASFRGSVNISHFNWGSTEDTYIRGGKSTSHVILNDFGSGKVGIGTSNPGFPLNFSNSYGDKISLWGNSGPHYGFGIQSYLLQIHTDAAAADIAFGYGSSSSFSETMRIKGNGNVGIGTNAPSATLDVNGQVKISGGAPGAGKILVSDANGLASWTNSSINTDAFAFSGGGTPQVIATSTSTVMAFPSFYVSENNYSTTDNSYTCPTSGFYHFDMQLTFRTITAFAGDKQLNIGFYVNASSIWNPPYLLRSSSVDNTYQFSFSTQLTTGDKVRFIITQNTGAIQQLLAGYFQGYRVY